MTWAEWTVFCVVLLIGTNLLTYQVALTKGWRDAMSWCDDDAPFIPPHSTRTVLMTFVDGGEGKVAFSDEELSDDPR